MAHFLDNVREVREEIMRTPGAHLVFVSITVSPENHENNKAKFLEVDTAVKNLFSPTPLKSTFCDIKRFFMLNSGKIDLDLFDEFERQQGDPVHLSKKGAKMVAQKLRKQLMSLPKAIFRM